MKILYHHRTKAADGQYVHIAELTGALAGLGHEVVMVGPGAPGERPMDSGGGSGGLRQFMPGWLYELLEFGYSGLALWRLWRACRRCKPDAIYERYNLFCPAGVWLKRLTGLPLALEVNAPLLEERRANGGLRLQKLARWTERCAWRGADICLPVTNVLAGKVAAEGVEPARLQIIPNGVGTVFLDGSAQPALVRERWGLNGKLVLGFTGFVRPWHGMGRAIDLLADGRLPANAHLLMVGDGPALPGLRAQAERLGVAARVTFTGVAQRHEIPSLVAAFDIALQPYVVPYASPLKLFEYMALGRAVVAPATANIQEVLTDGQNALLFDPEDPAAFGDAIVRLAGDAALRAAIGEAGRQALLTQDLTWRRNAERVIKLLEAARAAKADQADASGPVLASGAHKRSERNHRIVDIAG
jgi:glycosyltransferase involved in cell wall biosynthesis